MFPSSDDETPRLPAAFSAFQPPPTNLGSYRAHGASSRPPPAEPTIPDTCSSHQCTCSLCIQDPALVTPLRSPPQLPWTMQANSSLPLNIDDVISQSQFVSFLQRKGQMKPFVIQLIDPVAKIALDNPFAQAQVGPVSTVSRLPCIFRRIYSSLTINRHGTNDLHLRGLFF